MTISVWPVNAVSSSPLYAGRMLRQTQMAPLAVLGSTVRPLGGLSGVRSGTPTTTVTATSTTWTCKPHAGILDVESAAEAGPYGYAVDANVTGAVTAANASNPRVDLIYAKLSDPAESDGSTIPQVEILYLAGTAAATPSAPATPARGSALAWINVPVSGGGSPTVTWVAPGVTPGEVQFQTKALLDLWTTAAPKQRVTVINDATAGKNGVYVRSTSAWNQACASGIATFAGAGGGNAVPVYWSGTETVTFPVAFDAAPIVSAQMVDAVGGVEWVAVASVTATNFLYRIMRVSGVPNVGSKIQWTAVPAN